MSTIAPVVRHLDELSEFYVRDASLLQPGDKVIFGHLPTLANAALEDIEQEAFGYEVEIISVRHASYSEIHPKARGFDGSDRQDLMIFSKGEHTRRPEGDARHATDAGVEMYSGTWYNPSNFTVRVADLEAAGVQFSGRVSDEYRKRLNDFNKQIIVFDDLTDY